MKRIIRAICVVLAVVMVFGAIAPMQSWAMYTPRGAEAFVDLRDMIKTGYQMSNGAYAFAFDGFMDTDKDMKYLFVYEPQEDALTFSISSDGGKYMATLVIPSNLEMPYDGIMTAHLKQMDVIGGAHVDSNYSDAHPARFYVYDGPSEMRSTVQNLYHNMLQFLLRMIHLFLDQDGFTIGDLGFKGFAYEHGYLSDTEPHGHTGFWDVDDGDYFMQPVAWAVTNGVTNGTSRLYFSPEAACTRAQMVTFLWRAKGCPEPSRSSSPFRDVPANEYYTKAVLWAVEAGITNGTAPNAFSPEATVTRGQTVTFLWRMEGAPSVWAPNPFTDVPANEYYAPAVLWALRYGITKGTTDTTFSPEQSCTRAQIVTFLYRDLVDKREETDLRLDAANYLFSPKKLIADYQMATTTPQYAGGTGYIRGNFYLEYFEQYGVLTMKNSGDANILLYGAAAGDRLDRFASALERNGWKSTWPEQSDWTEYGTVLNGERLIVSFETDANGNVTQWFLINWPQGDYEDFFSQFD